MEPMDKAIAAKDILDMCQAMSRVAAALGDEEPDDILSLKADMDTLTSSTKFCSLKVNSSGARALFETGQEFIRNAMKDRRAKGHFDQLITVEQQFDAEPTVQSNPDCRILSEIRESAMKARPLIQQLAVLKGSASQKFLARNLSTLARVELKLTNHGTHLLQLQDAQGWAVLLPVLKHLGKYLVESDGKDKAKDQETVKSLLKSIFWQGAKREVKATGVNTVLMTDEICAVADDRINNLAAIGDLCSRLVESLDEGLVRCLPNPCIL